MAQRLEKGITDIDKLAQDLGLTRGTVPEFLRGGGAEPLGSSTDLQQTVFSDATLNQGKIGGPVGLGEDRLVRREGHGASQGGSEAAGRVHDEIVALLSRSAAWRRRRRRRKRRREARLPAKNSKRSQDPERDRRARELHESRRSIHSRSAAHLDLRSAAPDGPAGHEDGVARRRLHRRVRRDAHARGRYQRNPTLVQQQNAQLQQRSAQGKSPRTSTKPSAKPRSSRTRASSSNA